MSYWAPPGSFCVRSKLAPARAQGRPVSQETVVALWLIQMRKCALLREPSDTGPSLSMRFFADLSCVLTLQVSVAHR